MTSLLKLAQGLLLRPEIASFLLKIASLPKTFDKFDLSGRGSLLNLKPYPTIIFGGLKLDRRKGFRIFSNPLRLIFKYLLAWLNRFDSDLRHHFFLICPRHHRGAFYVNHFIGYEMLYTIILYFLSRYIAAF